MPTPLTDAINALTRYANETTGQSDTTLSDAVATLIEGYGQGGGGWTTDGIANGTEPNGDIVVNGDLSPYAFAGKPITSVVVNTTANQTNKHSAFRDCESLERIDIPNCTTIGGNDFLNGCSSLKHVNLSSITSIGGVSFFANCTALKVLRLPLTQNSSLPNYTFRYCSSLRVLALPKVGAGSGFPSYSFQGLNSIEVIDTSGGLTLSYIPSDVPLKLLIFRRTSGVPAPSVSDMEKTEFGNGKTGGDIYIPEVMYNHLGDGTTNDYLAKAVWSTLNGYGTITWHKLEGSPYEDINWDTSAYDYAEGE